MTTDPTLARKWWALALRGAIYVAFGLIALFWPGPTFSVILLLFGVFSLVDGVVSVLGAIRLGRSRQRWGALLFEGLVSAAVGAAVLAIPDLSGRAVLIVIGAWAVLTGVLEVAAAVRLRREIEGEWILVVNGILSIAFGAVLFLWPAAGIVAIVWMLGFYAVAFGALLLLLSLILRRHLADPPSG